jgi:hypothetical protein
MSQWWFVIAAYTLVLLATTTLIGWAFATMRKAEAEAEALKRRP